MYSFAEEVTCILGKLQSNNNKLRCPQRGGTELLQEQSRGSRRADRTGSKETALKLMVKQVGLLQAQHFQRKSPCELRGSFPATSTICFNQMGAKDFTFRKSSYWVFALCQALFRCSYGQHRISSGQIKTQAPSQGVETEKFHDMSKLLQVIRAKLGFKRMPLRPQARSFHTNTLQGNWVGWGELCRV